MASKNQMCRTDAELREQIPHPSIKTHDAFTDWVRSFTDQTRAAVVLALSKSACELAAQVALRDDRLEPHLLFATAFASLQNPEIELGAVIEDGEIYLSRGASHLGIREMEVESAALQSIRDLHDKRIASPELPRFHDCKGPVLIVDDGSVKLVTLLAVIRLLNNQNLFNVTLALPQSLSGFSENLETLEVKLIYFGPNVFESVTSSNSTTVRVPCGRSTMKGEFESSDSPLSALIICVSAASDGRLKRAAHQFSGAGFSVLSFDLLDETEFENSNQEYIIPLLAHRLSLIVEWISTQRNLRMRAIGLFGIGFASSASLQVAAQYPNKISAVVAHNMLPDLSHDYLRLVRAPTLFLTQVAAGSPRGNLALKTDICFAELSCEKRKLEIEDRDDDLVRSATDWFQLFNLSLKTERPPKTVSEAPRQTN